MLKTYKYRLYPKKQQEEQIQKTFGCCRFVYNQTLAYGKDLYENKKESMNKYLAIIILIKFLKKNMNGSMKLTSLL